MIKCPYCEKENPPNSSFCTGCGGTLEKKENKTHLEQLDVESVESETEPQEEGAINFPSEFKDVALAEGETYENYVKKIDVHAPYGRDPKGHAHLFPMHPIYIKLKG